MTKQEFKNTVLNKKGYYNNGRLKKGIKWLSKHFHISEALIIKAIEESRENKKIAPVQGKLPRLKDLPIVDKVIQPSNVISKPGTYLLLGCVHAPFHNKAMFKAMAKYLTTEGVALSGTILAGDIIDANSLSFHDKGNVPIPGVTLEWEYKEANKFLDDLDALADWLKPTNESPEKYFLYGNHEDRYNRLMKTNDAAKYGKALVSPREGLKLDKRGYKVFEDWKSDFIKFGDHLDINHGEFCNVHSAKKTIDTYRKSTAYFHTHRFQIYMEGMNAGFNLGWGGDINSPVFKYATRAMKNSWVNGFAFVTLHEDGYYTVQPVTFIKDKLVVNGREY